MLIILLAELSNSSVKVIIDQVCLSVGHLYQHLRTENLLKSENNKSEFFILTLTILLLLSFHFKSFARI